jgi:hypothetical protein
MDLSFRTDSARLVCELNEADQHTTISAADGGEAANAFLTAVLAVADDRLAECFWHEAGGDYRWMFRREGDRVDVAVMWCAGVITGWQHVFRGECPVDRLIEAAAQARGESPWA